MHAQKGTELQAAANCYSISYPIPSKTLQAASPRCGHPRPRPRPKADSLPIGPRIAVPLVRLWKV